MAKYWITKHALTKGIFEIEGRECSIDRMIQDPNRTCAYYHRDEFHTCKKRAIAKAEEMRLKKIASLKKQLARYEGLKFGADE